MNEFFQRLKQRKLVQWAIAYVAAAFALLQGIDIVAQQFGWPEGVRRGITLGLAWPPDRSVIPKNFSLPTALLNPHNTLAKP